MFVTSKYSSRVRVCVCVCVLSYYVSLCCLSVLFLLFVTVTVFMGCLVEFVGRQTQSTVVVVVVEFFKTNLKLCTVDQQIYSIDLCVFFSLVSYFLCDSYFIIIILFLSYYLLSFLPLLFHQQKERERKPVNKYCGLTCNKR